MGEISRLALCSQILYDREVLEVRQMLYEAQKRLKRYENQSLGLITAPLPLPEEFKLLPPQDLVCSRDEGYFQSNYWVPDEILEVMRAFYCGLENNVGTFIEEFFVGDILGKESEFTITSYVGGYSLTADWRLLDKVVEADSGVVWSSDNLVKYEVPELIVFWGRKEPRERETEEW